MRIRLGLLTKEQLLNFYAESRKQKRNSYLAFSEKFKESIGLTLLHVQEVSLYITFPKYISHQFLGLV